MNKILLVTITITFVLGCSQETRNEAVDRLTKAGKALNGEVRPNDKDNGLPNIVVEQERKERIRQNTQWTAENQKNHPIEYCQAQLDELTKCQRELEVAIHTLLTQKAKYQRNHTEAKSTINHSSLQLKELKKLYKDACANDGFPIEYNGYKLSKEKAGEILIKTKRQFDQANTCMSEMETRLSKISRYIDEKQRCQARIVELKDRIARTVTDLTTGNARETSVKMKDFLDSITDSVDALSDETEIPTFEDISTPTKDAAEKAELDAILSE